MNKTRARKRISKQNRYMCRYDNLLILRSIIRLTNRYKGISQYNAYLSKKETAKRLANFREKAEKIHWMEED